MSLETDGIIRYLKTTGIPHLVTGVVGTYVSAANPCAPHAPGSFHCALGTAGMGLAVDFAGLAPSRDSEALQAIYDAFLPAAPQTTELIYRQSQWKNGKQVAPFDDADNIHTHVHIAVARGTILAPIPQPPTGVKPMFDPPLPIVAYLDCPTGGSWLLGKDGAIYAVGGAPYLGACNGKPYFAGRTAARLNLDAGKYQIVATSGEVYGPGF